MAKTITTYQLNGSDREYAIPFEYLARKFIKVTLVGETRQELKVLDDYRFTRKDQITLSRAWGPSDNFTVLEVRRETSATDRLVNFSDGSILRAYDLNTSQVQAIHIAEEGRDISAAAMIQNGIFWDANRFPIRNVGYPTNLTDAANSQYVLDQIGRTLRGGMSDRLNELPVDRAGKLLGFDANRQPMVIIPEIGSGMALEVALADPVNGAGKIGYDGRRLNDYLTSMGYYRTIEYFGPTSTPRETLTTIQLAIDECSSRGWLLTAGKRRYVVDLSERGLTFGDGFRCDLGGAEIVRATGNKTPHDMLSNANVNGGNSGIDIRGVTLNGMAQADGLTNATVAHRFCGLSMIRCIGKLTDVKVVSTCNGEFQTEGVRGGILLKESVFIDCERIEAHNTIGTGLMTNGGRGSIRGFRSSNNTGSGISGDQPYWFLSDLESIGSGYSGISLNGPGWVAQGIRATGAPAGFAAVNFGHATPVTSNGVDCVASDVVAEDTAGWGINATSCPGIQGDNWVSKRAGVDGIRLVDCGGARITARVKDCGAQGLLIQGASGGHFTIEAQITGCAFSGVYVRNGADVVLGDSTWIENNGSAGGFAAGVMADTGSKVRVSGKVLKNKAYGVQAVDAGSILTVSGAKVMGNVTANTRQALGGQIRVENAKFSDDALSGVMTIVAGERTVKVFNKNMIDPNRIVLAPANEAGREAGVPLLATYTVEESFTFQVKSNVAADAGWRWALI